MKKNERIQKIADELTVYYYSLINLDLFYDRIGAKKNHDEILEIMQYHQADFLELPADKDGMTFHQMAVADRYLRQVAREIIKLL